jgi:uracil-DNA glycosylase
LGGSIAVVPTLADLEREAATCTKCPLAGGRTNVVFGVGDPDADLMFVGEGPGREEDLQGEPFVGRSGQLRDRLMREEIGISRKQVYIGNVLKCRPPNNRDPLPNEIEECRPFLEAQVDLIAPKVVITLGNFATRLLLDRKEGVTRLRGHTYPFRGGVLIPTFHPSAALRGNPEALAGMRADFVRAKEHLGLPPS